MKRHTFRASAAAAVGLVAAASLTACGSSGNDAPGQLVAATLVDVQSFDPTVNPGQGQRVFLDPVYDTLLRTDAEGNIVSGVATSYDLTPEYLDLTLEEGREFSNGESLDAEAVAANLEHRMASAGPASGPFANASGIEVTGPNTVRILLNRPAPALPIGLTDVAGILVAPGSLDAPDLGTNPVGSGPYVLDETASSAGVSYVYVPNERFANEEEQTLDRLEIRVLTDDAARAAAIRSGQVDISQIARAQTETVSSGDVTVDTFPGNYWMLHFTDIDGTQAPALENETFRQAVCTAIDTESIAESIFFGYADAQSQVFPPGNEFHVEDLTDIYSFDPEEARELLAESGVTDTSFTVPAFGPIQSVAEAIQGNLRDVGIDMGITVVQPGTLDQENRETNFPAIITPIKQVHPQQLYVDRLATNGPQNPFTVPHPEIDQAYERAANAEQDEERAAAFAEMQTLTADEALWCGLFQDQSIVAWNSEKVLDVENSVGWPMGPSFRGVTVQ